MSVVYLIRHGQASFGAAEYDQLSPGGFEQACVLGNSLRARLPRVDRVVSGTMSRHLQTAEACMGAHGADAPIERDVAFNEYDHVQLIDRFMDRAAFTAELDKVPDRRRAFQAAFEKAMGRWMSGEHNAEYDEPWPAFRARCLAAMDRLVAGLGASNTALVFSSGGPIAVIAGTLLALPAEQVAPLNWRMVNCSVTKVICGPRTRALSTFNEHACFEGEQAGRLLTYR